MRAALTLAICSMISSTTFGNVDDIIALKKLYYSSSESKSKTEKLVECNKDITLSSSKLLQGYKGMSLLLTAKQSWNPVNKLSDCKKGVSWLESSIAKYPNNIKLRFLRYSVQKNAPSSFLDYSYNIEHERVYSNGHCQQLEDKYLKTRISNLLALETSNN